MAQVTVETCKNIAAIEGFNSLARHHGAPLRQSYLRLAKRAAMMAGRYVPAEPPSPRTMLRSEEATLAIAISCVAGDAANAVVCAVSYNFRRVLAWLKTTCAQSSALSWLPLSPAHA